MAQCFACKKDISYGAMTKGIFKLSKRNLMRSPMNVFDCPHCGVTCQETAVSCYSFILLYLLFASIVYGMIIVLDRMSVVVVNKWWFVPVFLASYFVAHSAWWRRVAQTKEPFVFWREKKE